MAVNVQVDSKASGDYSIRVYLKITAIAPDSEPNLLLVKKSASTDTAVSASVEELLSIASPTDIAQFGTTETYPTPYRVSEATMIFPTTAKKTETVNRLLSDIQSAVEAYRNASSAENEVTLSATGTSTPPYNFEA